VRRFSIVLLPLLLGGCVLTPSSGPDIPEPTWPDPKPHIWVSGGASSDSSSGGGGIGGDIAAPETVASGVFTTKGPAFTYEPLIVPPGAKAQVAFGRAADGVTVRLAVTGMLPRRMYGAHLHTKPCTAKPADAGPHYRHVAPAASIPTSTAGSTAAKPGTVPRASAAPSAAAGDPAFANPQNEVWLDFTADGQGAATATAVESWRFDELAPPRSVVIHLTRTHTEPGMAGMAGDRVACLTLPG
jgi:Cu-Zn family superoxide dismutase